MALDAAAHALVHESWPIRLQLGQPHGRQAVQFGKYFAQLCGDMALFEVVHALPDVVEGSSTQPTQDQVRPVFPRTGCVYRWCFHGQPAPEPLGDGPLDACQPGPVWRVEFQGHVADAKDDGGGPWQEVNRSNAKTMLG